MADLAALVVVTGGASGIGASTVAHLARRGWVVAAADRDDATPVVDDVRAEGHEAFALHLDVSDPGSWEDAVEKVRRRGVPVRGLVNNAGIGGSGRGVLKTSDDDFQRVHAVNVYGPFYGMRAVAPLIGEAGGGSIVNVSSTAGLVGFHDAAYTSSKWALRGLTKSAAAELAPLGVRVNSVHPGLVATPMAGGAEDYLASHTESIPLGAPARPEQVAEAIGYLLGPESSYVTASELVVDGGFTGAGSYFRIAAEARRRRSE